jgi:transposase
MRKLSISNDKKNEIIEKISRSDESKHDHRLHGILLAANGMSPYGVSRVIGNSPKSIENWINLFLRHGFNGLREPSRSGRPPRLLSVMKNVATDLRKNPINLGYSQNLWDGKLLSHHLAVKYSISLGTRQCQRVFRKLGFRLRKQRAKIANGDDKKKEEFKKNSSPS